MADIASLIVRVKGEGISSTNREISSLSSFAGGASVAVAGLAASAAAAAVVMVKQSVQANRVFTKSLSDLSAITGATGDQLDYLTAQALDIGKTTQLSASQAAEAFKLIASAKPDLLESSAALNEVTRSAVTLSEAAGIELPEAATTLGSALNQFGADASEANRFINVLAAGAKFGASEIGETAIALKNSGVAAKATGVSFEEANAAIQALAAVGIKAGEAGTGLRNILLKLESSTDNNLKPSVNGLSGALVNLSKMQESTTQLTQRFGLENVTTAQALLSNVNAVADLTTKLTGTNTAYDQASTRTNNLDGDMKSLESAVESLSLAIGNKLNPAARSSAQLFTDSARAWASYIDSLGEAPQTIDGVRERLNRVNQELAETQARNKRFGANGIWDAITGGSGDKIQQMKDLQAESQRLLDLLTKLQGSDAATATAPTVVTPTETGTPETSAAGQAALAALEKRAELYRVSGVERAKLTAIQALGAEATDKEKQKAAELAAEIFNLNEAESSRAKNQYQQTQAAAYLEQLRQANLSEMQLVDAQQQEKTAKLLEYKNAGLVSEQQYQDALTEIQTASVLKRSGLENARLDLESKNREDSRRGELAATAEMERQKQKQIDDGIDAQRNMTANLKSALGEQSAIYKASAIATATIDTYKAATGAYAAMASIPYVGPVLGAVAAGAAIVAGLANVNAIRSAREQGGAMVGGSAYQMAERGKAEVIVPAGSSRARTAAQMRDIMGQNSGGTQAVTIINQTTGRADNVQTEQRSDGQLLITISEYISDQFFDPDSKISKARRATA